MNFLYPEFLWALSLIAIPIIIHLFNFRKFKKIYFSDISLLQNIQQKSKNKSQLKNILILISRILAISSLVLAFSYPFSSSINNINESIEKTVSVYIDNSLSMDMRGPNGFFLDLAKEQALNIADEYNSDVRFFLVTNQFDPRYQRDLSKNEFKDLVLEIQPCSFEKKLEAIYIRQSELLKTFNTQKDNYWLTDLQKSSATLDQIKMDSTLSIYLIPYLNNQKGNLYIDSIWFDNPSRKLNQQEILYVKVVNSFPDNMQFKLELNINENETKGLANGLVNGNDEIISEIPFVIKSHGIKHGLIKLSEYPNPDLTFDDEYYLSYSIREKTKVLHIYDGNKDDNPLYFNSLYSTTPQIDFSKQNLNQLDFSIIQDQDLIILDGINSISSGFEGILSDYISTGKSIVLFPGADLNFDSFNLFYKSMGIQFLSFDSTSAKIKNLNLDHPVFNNVFEKIPNNMNMPSIHKRYKLNILSNSLTDKIISFNDQNSFLIHSDWNDGEFFTFTSPLRDNASNFVNHALFVPILLRITELCGTKQKLAYTVGKDQIVKTNVKIESPSELSISKSNKEESGSFIPGYKKNNQHGVLLIHDQIKDAGNYNVISKINKIDGFSYNHNRSESEMDFYSIINFKEQLIHAGINEQVKIFNTKENGNNINFIKEAKGIYYWKYFIVLTLVFLGLEILLIRIL